MSKRVHQIAKERGLPAKDVLERLQAAGVKVKAVSSSVDEADARRVLDAGDGQASARTEAPTHPQAADSGARQQRPAQRSNGGNDRQQRDQRASRSDAPAARAEASGPRSEARS